MIRSPALLLRLAAYLKKLPGVGTRSAERFAFQMLFWSEAELRAFSELTASLRQRIAACPECHCLAEEGVCAFCDPGKRDSKLLCVVSSARDVYPIEQTRTFHGLYHSIDCLLSPMEDRMPEQLQLPTLKTRIQTRGVEEVILALDSTLEGDATALFLKQELASLPVHVTRLAFGLPMGSSLDFVDTGTLTRALSGRQLL